MTDEALIEEASRRLAAAAPDAKVILFGSPARGEGRPDSDLDLLVIEPQVTSRRAEFVRLREALGDPRRSGRPRCAQRRLRRSASPDSRGTMVNEAVRRRPGPCRSVTRELKRWFSRGRPRADAKAVQHLAPQRPTSATRSSAFIAQQAVEKWLKAVLGSRGYRVRVHA